MYVVCKDREELMHESELGVTVVIYTASWWLCYWWCWRRLLSAWQTSELNVVGDKVFGTMLMSSGRWSSELGFCMLIR